MSRHYPSHPLVGVGAIVIDGAGEVLIVKRAREPLAGRWSLPGGVVELGETLHDAVVREVREETGLEVVVGRLADVVERVYRDPEGRVEYHYVLLDYVCHPAGGTLGAGTDAAEAVFAAPAALDGYGIAAETRAVIERALALRGADRRSG